MKLTASRSSLVARVLCVSVPLWGGVSQASADEKANTPTKAEALSVVEPPPSAVDAGRKTYTSYCARCHGINMATPGGGTFDLRTLRPDEKERFVRSVSKGVRAMPAWEGTLKSTDIDAIWSYLGSVNGWAAGGMKQSSTVLKDQARAEGVSLDPRPPQATPPQ